MSVEVEKTTVPQRFRAWCHECQDGYQGGKPTVIKWANKHDKENHTR